MPPANRDMPHEFSLNPEYIPAVTEKQPQPQVLLRTPQGPRYYDSGIAKQGRVTLEGTPKNIENFPNELTSDQTPEKLPMLTTTMN